MSVDEDSPEEPPSVRNPGDQDFNQKQRLQQFWDARNSLAELHEELSLKMGQTVGEQRAEWTFHREFNHYLIVTSTLYLDLYPDFGQQLWYQELLGTQPIEPPASLVDEGSQFNAIIQEPARAKKREFEGLQSLLNTEPVADVNFQATAIVRHEGLAKETETKRVTVPWNVLNTAWMLTESFMDQIGLGAETGGEEDRDAPTL